MVKDWARVHVEEPMDHPPSTDTGATDGRASEHIEQRGQVRAALNISMWLRMLIIVRLDLARVDLYR